MNENQQNPTGRGRGKLLLLAAIFFAPIIFAYVFYFLLPGFQPDGRTNKGHLIVPAKPLEMAELRGINGDALSETAFKEKWTLLQIGPSDCTEVCQRMLWNTRQVRESLGRRMERVQRVFVATDRVTKTDLNDWLAREHPDLKLGFTEHASGKEFVEFFNTSEQPADAQDYVYLLDPLGNWLMYYTPEEEPKDMFQDLKKLLKLSGIG